MKIVAICRSIDEDISIIKVVDSILSLEPENLKYQNEKLWLQFSN
jgi:hypothetical protein